MHDAITVKQGLGSSGFSFQYLFWMVKLKSDVFQRDINHSYVVSLNTVILVIYAIYQETKVFLFLDEGHKAKLTLILGDLF